MFADLINIIQIDLTNFDFSSVIDLTYFFGGCSSLKSVDLSNVNAENVKYMNSMFF